MQGYKVDSNRVIVRLMVLHAYIPTYNVEVAELISQSGRLLQRKDV